jgi:hypothetical protein
MRNGEMRIKTIDKCVIYYVETDDEEWPEYRRVGESCWENRMGESWEPAYFEEEELEAAFRKEVANMVEG